MLAPRTAEAFLAEPRGGYVAGASWLYFVLDAGIYGFSLFGVPRDDDMRAFVARMEIELARPRHPALVDLSRLERVEPASFDLLIGYFTTHAEALARVVTQSAVVLPGGMNRAIAHGFFGVVPAPFAVHHDESIRDALARLGHPDPDTGSREVEDARDQVIGVPTFLRDLRLFLERDVAEASVAAAARTFAVSERSLQRLLTAEGTTFAKELAAARMRVAEHLLTTGDALIQAIAIAVGAGNAAHFSTLFRKHRGTTPSEFRAKRR